MLSISFAKEADTSDKHELKTENVMLSVEQPDVLRAGLNSAVLDTLPLKPASFQDRRKDMLKQVAVQFGVGAAVRRQADLKVVEQFHR